MLPVPKQLLKRAISGYLWHSCNQKKMAVKVPLWISGSGAAFFALFTNGGSCQTHKLSQGTEI